MICVPSFLEEDCAGSRFDNGWGKPNENTIAEWVLRTKQVLSKSQSEAGPENTDNHLPCSLERMAGWNEWPSPALTRSDKGICYTDKNGLSWVYCESIPHSARLVRKMELCSCGLGGYQNFHFCCFMYVVSNNYLIKIRAIKRLDILLDRLHKLCSY